MHYKRASGAVNIRWSRVQRLSMKLILIVTLYQAQPYSCTEPDLNRLKSDWNKYQSLFFLHDPTLFSVHLLRVLPLK